MDKETLTHAADVNRWMLEHKTDVISFDTETSDLQYSVLQLEGISICNGTSSLYIDLFENPEFDRIIELLRLFFKSVEIVIGHNLVFDLKVLHKYGIDCNHCQLYDTMVADHLIDENRRHGLKFLAGTILGEETIEYEKASVDKHSETFYNYAHNDTIWTWRLMQYSKPKLCEQGLLELFRNIEMPFLFSLVEAATEGVLVDLYKVEQTTIKLQKEIEDLTIKMLDILQEDYDLQLDLEGHSTIVSSINFNSSIDLAKILFEKLNLPVTETTPSGKPSVGKKTLYNLKGQHEFVTLLEQYKIAQKLLSSFFLPLPGLVEDDDKVRPNFLDCGTKTGRLSCNNPNLQQLPRVNKTLAYDTRECFIAPKGYKMIACDYSGQELRVLTEITKDPVLVSTFNEDKDMHLATAKDFFNLDIPKEALHTTHPDNEKYKEMYKDERNKAKCFHPNTEVLTKEGWKKIVDITTDTEIIQAIPERGWCKLEWANPIEVFTQYHDSKKLISLENEGTSLQVTPDHRMLAFNHRREHYVTTPQEFGKARYWCNAGYLPNDRPIDLTEPNFIKLIVATQADGSYTKTNIRFGFTKERKIKRMDAILSSYPKTQWSKTIQKNMTTFRIVGNLCQRIKRTLPEKTFDYSLLDLGFTQIGIFINELKYWDSHQNKFKRSFTYSTKQEINADVVQSLCSVNQRKSYKRYNGKCWVLSIKDHATSRGENLKIKEVEFTDKVSCLSVPSTFVLVRYNGKTTITGQTINFGIAYGKGAFGFSKDFGISEEEAQGILDKYFGALPGVKKAIEDCDRQVKTKGFVRSLTGRYRRFQAKEVDGYSFYPKSSFRQAFNFLIQGYSADMIRMAINKVYKGLKKEWDCKLIMTVHDEAVYTVKEEYAKDAAKYIKETFESAVELCIPLKADVSIGKTYSEVK